MVNVLNTLSCGFWAPPAAAVLPAGCSVAIKHKQFSLKSHKFYSLNRVIIYIPFALFSPSIKTLVDVQN
jgi:hypothetical protein